MKGFVGTRDKTSKLGESRKRQRSLRCWLKGSSSHRDCRILLITGKWFVVSVNIFFSSLCSLFKAGYNQSLSKKKRIKKKEKSALIQVCRGFVLFVSQAILHRNLSLVKCVLLFSSQWQTLNMASPGCLGSNCAKFTLLPLTSNLPSVNFLRTIVCFFSTLHKNPPFVMS